MTARICATCGNWQADAPSAPEVCAICADERQWVPKGGQRWTTLQELEAAGHSSETRDLEPGLLGIGTTPPVAIGQRSLLVQTDAGNVLWDLGGYLDDAAVQAVTSRGELVGIAASHPHFYGAISEWSERLGGVPILLPEADVRWLLRPSPNVRTWSGTLEVVPGVTLVQCGGHFPGSAVLHWAAGADNRGALLTGDTIMVTPGQDRVTFLRSAPNRIPLPERLVRQVVAAVEPFPFDRIYTGWWDLTLDRDAKTVLHRDAERYIAWLRGDVPED
jgi:glyoxylase-like metal-dependent hydrolase (beta-lactamase superfamily II)